MILRNEAAPEPMRSNRLYETGSFSNRFQALRAWLPSFSPPGQKLLFPIRQPPCAAAAPPPESALQKRAFFETRPRRCACLILQAHGCKKTGRNLSRIVTPPSPDCHIFLFKSDSSCCFAGGGLTFRRLLGKKGLCLHDIQGERTKTNDT